MYPSPPHHTRQNHTTSVTTSAAAPAPAAALTALPPPSPPCLFSNFLGTSEIFRQPIMAIDKADRFRQLEGHEYKGDILQEWGEPALKNALIAHLSEAYPQNKQLADDLFNHYLSPYHLTKVTQKLLDEGVVKVARVRTDKYDRILHHPDGLRLVFDNLAVLISLGGGHLKEINATVWKNSFKQLPASELSGVVIDPRVLEKWKGFRAGMHNYALQVAGLMHLNSLDDGPDFWEEYKKYMVFIEPAEDKEISFLEELAKEKIEAQKFNADMRLTMEAVPRYSGYTRVVSNPVEEEL